MNIFVGVDIDKKKFIAAVLDKDRNIIAKNQTFKANRAGFDEFAALLGSLAKPEDKILFAVEASGNLHLNLIVFLYQSFRNIVIYIINPLTVSRYGNAKLHRNHTDPDDANHIALMLAKESPSLHSWEPHPADTLRRVVMERGRLVSQRTAETNRLYAVLHLNFPEFVEVFRDPSSPLALHILKLNPTAAHFARRRVSTFAKQRPYGRGRHTLGSQRADRLITLAKQSVASALSKDDAFILTLTVNRIQSLDKQILQLENHIKTFITQLYPDDQQEPSFISQIRLIDSLPGIGLTIAASVTSYAHDIPNFKSASAFSAFIGTCPQRSQTGTSRDTACLTPYANRSLRPLLFMATRSALRCFPPLRFYLERHMRNGLKYKQALSACMNRLVHWIYGVVVNNTPFDPQHAYDTCARQFPREWETFCKLNSISIDRAA